MATGYWIYPENYVPPTPPTPYVLTEPQRAAVKTQMQNYINNHGVPIWSVDLIITGQVYILNNYNKTVSYAQLDEIASEILAEWGGPE
jgi:hypothetical protein